MKPWKTRQIDPYRILFPLGLLHSILGTGLWIAFVLGWTEYPANAHAEHMIPGFLLSFAAGFMLTAVPRFTGSAPCTREELAFAASLSLLMIIWPHPPVALALLVFLLFFFARRFSTRSYPPPPHFVLVPLGMLLGILGAAILSAAEFGLSSASITSGRLLLYYGPILCFVLGIGSRLISALFGWGETPFVQITNLGASRKNTVFVRIHELEPGLLAIALVSGFLLEISGSIAGGRTLRALAVSAIAFPRWNLHRLPQQKGKLALWLWISAWMLVIGVWTQALRPELGIHAAHLYFIGSFGLMTLMIASRVTLAHGGYDTTIEMRSRVLTFSGALIFLAAWTRFSAPLTQHYTHHLAYAASVWIAAMATWGMFFVPRMARKAST